MIIKGDGKIPPSDGNEELTIRLVHALRRAKDMLHEARQAGIVTTELNSVTREAATALRLAKEVGYE